MTPEERLTQLALAAGRAAERVRERSEIEVAAIEWAKARVNFQNYALDRSSQLDRISLARLLVLCTAEIERESAADAVLLQPGGRKQFWDPGVFVTGPLKRSLAVLLQIAWQRYAELLGEPPHGTLKQMNALVELTRLDDFVYGITNHAIARWYADGHDNPIKEKPGPEK